MEHSWRSFMDSQGESLASAMLEGGHPLVGRFADLAAEHAALAAEPAIMDRSYRALLELTGKDRAAWLHNLTTNEVRNLTPGEGNYAFATNVQGRILFDLNVLVFSDKMWLDIDRRFLDRARAHFEKYHIVEDVRIADRSDEFVRIGLAGRGAIDLLKRLGVGNAAAMPSLGTSQVKCRDIEIPLMRHDFCGPFGAELLVPADRAVALWDDLVGGSPGPAAIPVGAEAVQVRRIEAGIPWPGLEITEDVLPAETGQLERAVSFQKGCYLGQEVVERMRSRGSLARRLCGLRIAGDAMPPLGAELQDNAGRAVGRITSACHSVATGAVIALAYLKTASTAPGHRVQVAIGDIAADAEVAELPFAPAAT